MTSVEHFVPDAEADTSPRVVAAYIEAYTDVNDLIVDPFCRSPICVTTAVAAGRRAVAVNFSPLDALRTRLALVPVPTRDLDAAATRISDSPKFDMPLRRHLLRLYRTACRSCGNEVIADYFVWERGRDVPSQVSYRCAACGDAGLRDCVEADVQVLKDIDPRGLHYWYVLDRAARQDDEPRRFAAELLELYTPRSLYVLYNLVLKAEDLFAGSTIHDFLRLALLRCLELGSVLNPAPGDTELAETARLRPPPRFVEWNVWHLFENSTRELAQRQPAALVPLAASAQDVSSSAAAADQEAAGERAAAFVGHVSVRELVALLPGGSVRLVLSQPPQLGRTLWALPFLWTGWLYGHEESALLWPLVRRRSSDWPWYLRAMRATLTALKKALQPDGHVVFAGPDRELAYHETLALAAAGADLRPERVLYQPTEPTTATKPFSGLRGNYRLTWTWAPPTPPWPMSTGELTTRLRQAAVAAVVQTLQARAEPAPFARLHCQIWEALAQQGVLQRAVSLQEQLSPLSFVRDEIKIALEAEVDQTLQQLWEDEEEGTCWWWLTEPPEAQPLAERVEQAVNEALESAELVATADLVGTIYEQFPAVLTPDSDWLMACLESYGQQTAPTHWRLHEHDHRAQRIAAHEALLDCLLDLGQRLGHDVVPGADGLDVQWRRADRPVVAFVVLDSAALSRLLELGAVDTSPVARRLAVIPAARLDLLRLRLSRSQWLRKELATRGWQFIQDVDLLEWGRQDEVTVTDLDSLVGLDPLSIQDRTQLPLI